MEDKGDGGNTNYSNLQIDGLRGMDRPGRSANGEQNFHTSTITRAQEQQRCQRIKALAPIRLCTEISVLSSRPTRIHNEGIKTGVGIRQLARFGIIFPHISSTYPPFIIQLRKVRFESPIDYFFPNILSFNLSANPLCVVVAPGSWCTFPSPPRPT